MTDKYDYGRVNGTKIRILQIAITSLIFVAAKKDSLVTGLFFYSLKDDTIFFHFNKKNA